MIGRLIVWSITGMLGLLALAAAAMIAAPSVVGARPVVVLSGSMEPTLDVGGLALIEEIDPKEVRVGDVISFEAPSDPEVLITHRVVDVVSESPLVFQTKGDAVENPDPFTVPAETIAGVVRFHVPQVGLILEDIADFVRSPLGFVAVMGGPSALLIAFEARNLWVWTSPSKRRERHRRQLAERLKKQWPEAAKRAA